MLAPIAWRVPPRHYGPWERVVSLLTEALVARGVEVTLFATANSLTSAKLAAVCPLPYEEAPDLDAKVWEALHISSVFERAAEFDLIHNHFDFLPLVFSELTPTPVVTTIHGFSSERILPVYQKYNGRAHYVAISEADRHPSLEYAATIYHGIDLEAFPEGSGGDYLVYFGRIHPHKGTAEAIQLATRMRRRLVIAGIVQDQGYFEREVRPRLRPGVVEYAGSVGPAKRAELLGGALALIHLINFDEPFGLSVVEALACGTPVVATPRGSMPELIRDGENGLLVDSVEQAAARGDELTRLDRARIRAEARRRFSAERMADEYGQVYERILSGLR